MLISKSTNLVDQYAPNEMCPPNTTMFSSFPLTWLTNKTIIEIWLIFYITQRYHIMFWLIIFKMELLGQYMVGDEMDKHCLMYIMDFARISHKMV